ncbi:MAG: zinc ribbon domain-containing protein [Deltaproteobacteria bacterium]|nr:zinc ribbon domain-containing protein [Deltaproteobacteria bacterium]
MKRSVKCSRCGFENLPQAKYCSNCGAKITVLQASEVGFEGVFILHVLGSAYLLTSLFFNAVLRTSVLRTSSPLPLLYLASGVLGLVSAWEFNRWPNRKFKSWVKVLSSTAMVLGLAGTLIIFFMELGSKGIVEPAWLIFVINAYAYARAQEDR